MDSYVEDSVSISNNSKAKALFILMVVIAAASLIATFIWPLIFFVPFIAASFLAWYFRLSIVLDYDYTLVNDTIDFAKIRGKSRRKLLFSLDTKDIEVMAKEGAPELDGYNNRNLKTVDLSSPEEERERWLIITTPAGGNRRIIFQPSDEMVTEMKRRNPTKVIRRQYGA